MGTEDGYQGCLGSYRYFGQDGCLRAGNLETGVLESCLPFGSAGLSDFSHLRNGVDLRRPECCRGSFPFCLWRESFEKKEGGVGAVFHAVFEIPVVFALNPSRECKRDLSHLK